MELHDWPADDYAIGAYIQASASNYYLSEFQPKTDEKILDVGCGDGSYSLKVLEHIPHGKLLGIDVSQSMLDLAQQKANQYPNFSVQQCNILQSEFSQMFDHVVSFWCLQWTDDIVTAFSKIYQALKPGGRVFALFPSGDDPFMQSFKGVLATHKFPELESFVPPMDFNKLNGLEEKLNQLPYTKIKVARHQNSLELPSLDVFRRFIYGIGFYQGQVAGDIIPKINDAMIAWFDNYCQKHHGGRYLFEFSPYWVTGQR